MQGQSIQASTPSFQPSSDHSATRRLCLHLARFTTARLLTLALGGLIVAAVAGFTALSSSWPNRAAITTGPAMPQPSADKAQAAVKQYDVERITLRPTGFDPPVISRTGRSFYLMIENRTGSADLSFEVKNEAGARVYASEIRVPRGKLAWRGAVNLPPGKYEVKELSRPQWVLSLTVAP
jgi:hypothetical protein